MTRFLALDQSKERTGWAFWHEGLDRPLVGHFKLGDEYTPPGKVFGKLHMQLSELLQVHGFDRVRYEQPADPAHLDRANKFNVPFLLIGIAAHIDSFCAAKLVKCEWVHAATWRRHYIGSMPRGTKRPELKDFVERRCRELGMTVRNDDEADACGILDYDMQMAGFTPPWRAALP
jgi:hypothetical protein